MTIKFFIQSHINPANIYVRMSLGRGKDIKKKTGFITDPKKFKVDLKLRELQNRIERAYNEAMENNKKVDSKWLESVIKGVKEKKTIQSHIDAILEEAGSRPNAKGGVGLSENRIKIYITFKNILTRFQEEMPFGEIDLEKIEDFKNWMFDQKYSINYVGKNVELIKTVSRDAEMKGALINKEIYRAKTLKEKTIPITLTESDLEKIEKLKIERDSLRNVRKWLLLGCQIGQRGSDLLNLLEEDIKDINGMRVFEITQFKTGKMVYVPLNPKALKVIEDGFPYSLSMQKMNDHLKEIAKMAGINKKLSTHVCRRSFATNYYGKIPTSVLMGITGHSSEQMFMKYIGKSSLDNAFEFARYFEKN